MTEISNITENKPSGILVWGETMSDGEFAPVSLQLVTKACELSKNLGNCWVTVLMAGASVNIEHAKQELLKYGANELAVIDLPELAEYNTRNYAQAVLDYLDKSPKEVFLIGATRQGRDLAPQISSALSTGLTADSTGLEINPEGRLAATRPTFGGELMATILCKTYPQMATVRPNVFEAVKVPINERAEDIPVNYHATAIEKPSLKKIVEKLELSIETDSIENAKILLGGGKGLKDKETFEKLYKLAQKLGAQVGASRKAVDAGLVPHSVQIGQTGKTVSPDLYIAFGISGAIQHCVGVNGAKTIIAVNNDPDAPITKTADKTIVADAAKAIEEWLSAL